MIQVIATYEESKNILIVKAPENIQEQVKKILLVLDSPTNKKELYISKMNYIPAQDLATIITNIIRYKNLNGICVGDIKTNKIVLLEEKENLSRLIKIIKDLDKEYNQKHPSFIIKMKNAKSDNIASLLGQIK
jgi:type II secretory pathway component GspD/PulD (secretin)